MGQGELPKSTSTRRGLTARFSLAREQTIGNRVSRHPPNRAVKLGTAGSGRSRSERTSGTATASVLGRTPAQTRPSALLSGEPGPQQAELQVGRRARREEERGRSQPPDGS